MSADELSAIRPPSSVKKIRRPKPYVPALRSGPYAIILALSALPEESTAGLTKAQIIDRAQVDCEASFTAPGDTTKYHTAWSSMKTLQDKDLVYERGRPLRRYFLTDEGWEVAKRIRAVGKGGKQPTYPEAIPAGSSEITRNAIAAAQSGRLDDSELLPRSLGVYPGRDFDAARLHGVPRNTVNTQNASAAPQRERLEDFEALPRPLGIYPGRDFDAARLHGVPRATVITQNASATPQRERLEDFEALPRPLGIYPGRDFDAVRLHGVPRISAITRNANAALELERPDGLDALPRPGPVCPGRDFDAAKLHGVPRNPHVTRNASTAAHPESLDDFGATQLHGVSSYPGKDFGATQLYRAVSSRNDFDAFQLPRRASSRSHFDALQLPRGLSPPPEGEMKLANNMERGQRLGGAVTDKFGPFSESRVRGIPAKHDIVEILSSPERPQRIQGDSSRRRLSPRPQGDTRMRSSPEPPRWAREDTARMRSSPEREMHHQGSDSKAKTSHKERETTDEVVYPLQNPSSSPALQPIKLQPGSFTVQLVLDIREVRAKDDRDYFQDELVKKGIKALVRPLDLGDFLWVAKCNDPSLLARYGEEGDEVMLDWIVERKRLDDLIGSIKDGRFHEQKFRLRKSGVKNVVYLIEEFSVSSERMTSFQEAIESSIASTQVVDGYFIKKTTKLDETIRYLARMTVMLKSIYEVCYNPAFTSRTCLLESVAVPTDLHHSHNSAPIAHLLTAP